MSRIILLDQDCQHYRLPIYKEFQNKFEELGFELHVGYDKKLNDIDIQWIHGIEYSFQGVTDFTREYKPEIIIHNFWLRYLFVFPFLLYCKIKGIKNILWSHGINLQNKKQPLLNTLYYLRQYLADALIIYAPEQKKYIKPNHKKLFVANNTLSFKSLPQIMEQKEEIKRANNLENKFMILCVGRMNNNNRKVEHLLELENKLDESFKIILIGPGVKDSFAQRIKERKNIRYLGPIYDQEKVCKYYKMADLFCMPGAIGLAINQAFYFETPVLVENVDQGPEATYLKDGVNGFYYNAGDIDDLSEKVTILKNDEKLFREFSNQAKITIESEGSIEVMFEGFKSAIEYVNE